MSRFSEGHLYPDKLLSSLPISLSLVKPSLRVRSPVARWIFSPCACSPQNLSSLCAEIGLFLNFNAIKRNKTLGRKNKNDKITNSASHKRQVNVLLPELHLQRYSSLFWPLCVKTVLFKSKYIQQLETIREHFKHSYDLFWWMKYPACKFILVTYLNMIATK